MRSSLTLMRWDVDFLTLNLNLKCVALCVYLNACFSAHG